MIFVFMYQVLDRIWDLDLTQINVCLLITVTVATPLKGIPHFLCFMKENRIFLYLLHDWEKRTMTATHCYIYDYVQDFLLKLNVLSS